MKKYVFCKLMLIFLMTATGCLEKTPEDGKTDNPSNPSPEPGPTPDPGAPSVKITGPAAGTATTSAISLAGTCTVSLATVDIGGATPASTSCGTNGTFSVTITLAAPTGSKTVTVSQTNTNGTGSDSRSFTLNPEAPTVSINSPAANTITKNSINLQGSCDSPVSTVSINGASPASTTCSNGSFNEMVTLSGSDGSKTVTVSQTNSGGTGSNSRSFVLDATAPSPVSILINSGASYSNSTSATLTLSATDANEGIEMYITNISGCSGGGSWENFSSSKSWNLGQTNATAMVYAKFRDAAGNESGCTSDTIVHDAQAPTAASVSLNSGSAYTSSASVTLTLSASDSNSGIEQYITNNAGCSSGGSWEVLTSSKSWVLGQTNGSATVYAKYRDQAGNESGCLSATIIHDNLAPTSSSISIAGGAAFTISTSVSLTLAAVGADQMYITNTAGCGSGGSYEAFNTSKTWTLGQTNSTATVFVKFRDNAGNESSCVNDSIVHDSQPPTSPSISIAGGANYTTTSSVTLTLSAIGADQMYVTNTAGCGSGGTYEAYNTSKSWTLGQTNATATVYVKFRDWAGNETGCVNDSILYDLIQVTAGSQHTCVLGAVGGFVKCWGYNGSGQFGNGSTTSSITPVNVTGLSGASQIATSVNHTCALISSNGSVKCWGDNTQGQLGNGSTTSSTTPVNVTGITGASQISTGNGFTCALIASDGSVKCWGGNNVGQLGNGTTTASTTPVTVAGITGASKVSLGQSYGCALISSNGSVKCWGFNANGQLGNGSTISSTTPVIVAGITDASEIAAGYSQQTCALLGTNGSIKCWGLGVTGELGNGSFGSSNIPVSVTGITGASQISTGNGFTCALIASDGSVRCWGFNGSGQLGNGSTTSSNTPVIVTGITGASQIDAGNGHTCAVMSVDGSLKCWGINDVSQLGDGSTTDSSIPVVAQGIRYFTPATQIAGGYEHNCERTSTGGVKCWGYNVSGQLGNGSTANSSTPVVVSGLPAAVQVTAGSNHSCALLDLDGSVRCWGYNFRGQLGNGSTSNSSVPIVVSGLTGVSQVAAGSEHTCALMSADGSVKCWGYNSSGQLGNGTTTSSSIPVNVTGLIGVAQIVAGNSHTCAVMAADGAAKCWGYNGNGQLGNGSTSSSNTPVNVTGLTEVSHISAGYAHTCAVITSNGSIKCWGYNIGGQLGNGTTSDSPAPVNVSGLTGASQVASGDDFTCALMTSDGSVKCWGYNGFGQLGNGLTSNFSTPPGNVLELTGVSQIIAGGSHVCALITSNGSVKCWGFNERGQLGEGTLIDRYVPVYVNSY